MSEYKSDRKALWVFFGLIGLLVLAYAVMVVLMLTTPPMSIEWFLSYVGLLVIVVATVVLVGPIAMAAFKLRNDAREYSVREQHSSAFVVTIVTAKGAAKQLRALAEAIGAKRPAIRSNRYATAAADASSLRLFVGGRDARQELEIPLSQLVSADTEVLKAPTPVPSIVLRFSTPTGEFPLRLVPLHTPGIVAKPLPEEPFNELLGRLQPQVPAV